MAQTLPLLVPVQIVELVVTIVFGVVDQLLTLLNRTTREIEKKSSDACRKAEVRFLASLSTHIKL